MDKYTGRVSGILSATPSCFKQHNMFFQSIIVGAFIGECSPQSRDEGNETNYS